jgi:hypothetical protein
MHQTVFAKSILMHSVLMGVAAWAGLGLLASPAVAADPVSSFYDNQLKGAEHDTLGLIQAMPADKFKFAPSNGAFNGVRTFATQSKHVATIIYMLSAAALNEKPPVDIGEGDDGPATLTTKAQIVDYVKGAFAYAHKAIATLTTANQLETVKSPFGEGMVPRIMTASMVTSHTFDHYGQMVVYARMN